MSTIWVVLTIFTFTIQLGATQTNSVERKVIYTDKNPEPLEYFSQAVQANNVLYISGNIGMTRDGQMVEGITNQTKLTLDNIGHVLEAAGATFGHVVKVLVFLSDMNDFDAMNDVYKLYFGDKPPARSTVMASLIFQAKVEIEAVAYVGNIIDVDDKGNDAPRAVGILPTVLVLIQGLAIYRNFM